MTQRKTYVLDTNVLLADPEAINAFPDSLVVIPETVFGELDRLKTSRADQDLRFKGREVSRELFALSEKGKLSEGVTLKTGSELLVVGLDNTAEVPSEYNSRSSDDRILAIAYQLALSGHDVTMVTNDLNMLLKAQAEDLDVQRYGDDTELSWVKRTGRGAWRRNRVPILTAVAVLLAFAAVLIVLRVAGGVQTNTEGLTSLPPEFERLLPATQKEILEGLQDLEQNPDDLATLIHLGNLYYNLGRQPGGLTHMQTAVGYYEQAADISPLDPSLGTDLATAYFYLGQTDKAISQIQAVLKANPEFANALYNYGVFLLVGKNDPKAAAEQFTKVTEVLPENDPVAARARQSLEAIEASLQALEATPSGV